MLLAEISESLSAEDMSVKLSRSCARHIHQLWSQSIQERFAEEEVAIHQMMEKGEHPQSYT